MTSAREASKLGQFSWALFDWANQPFFTVVTTFIFAPYFANVMIGDAVRGQATWAFTQSTFTEVDGWPAISRATSWLNATASYAVTPRVKIYVEGKNLTNTIVRTFLNGDSNAIWSAGATGTGSGVDSGYSAFGRTITVGVGMTF